MATVIRETDGEASRSAIHWSAILGGAFVAIATSLALLALGSALGLASVSPWSNHNPSPVAFTAMMAIWMIVMQWISAGVGGYLTGRFRVKWTGSHTDEVFFRDTAHGFVTWAVATVVTATFAFYATGAVIGGAAKATSAVAAGEASKGGPRVDDYTLDNLLRGGRHSVASANDDVRGETTRILVHGIRSGDVPASDHDYLVNLVQSRSDLSRAEASARVDEAITKTRDAANTARKTAATVSLFTFLSMVIGAFIASAAAALGGRHRDFY